MTPPRFLRTLLAATLAFTAQLATAASAPRPNVICFLASDLASYMTGEVVAVSSQHP